MTTVEYDVVVVGASLGGVAAALAAAHGGCTVCLVEPGSWAGGQMTVQGVCRPDDTGAVNTISGTRTYRTFRNRCRDYYKKNYKLSTLGASAPVFNAGAPYMADQMNLSVSPKLGDTVLKHMLAEPRRFIRGLAGRSFARTCKTIRLLTLPFRAPAEKRLR